MANTQTFQVNGMTCSHCELSVQEEISEISGVEEVKADHTTGKVAVVGGGYSQEQIADAVAEAGYTLEQ
ncbi:heavy-metal-associated domain-containing protein [Corynebacterium tapiri]|uniref:Heavy-metal-associated domain-containing protein n=1 Tax=Corynebacterium tapiri TaxID=1448266 RepID=A0A5C4U1L6_9CORY|nr:heavy-metal-associated domain-containing protein [Corynebacterium tapiri]TNL95337.1 heavy-metal-associated domain-containing protein [Corynebacterium tapiri]